MKTLQCSRCKERKPATLDYFYKESRNTIGLQYQCKQCKKIIDREYRGSSLAHKEYQKSPRFAFVQTRYQAKKRNIPFNIDYDWYKKHIAHKPCIYCGEEETKNWPDRYINDHNIGYTEENSVPCCETCNKMKMMHDPDFFIKHCTKVSNHNVTNQD